MLVDRPFNTIISIYVDFAIPTWKSYSEIISEIICGVINIRHVGTHPACLIFINKRYIKDLIQPLSGAHG